MSTNITWDIKHIQLLAPSLVFSRGLLQFTENWNNFQLGEKFKITLLGHINILYLTSSLNENRRPLWECWEISLTNCSVKYSILGFCWYCIIFTTWSPKLEQYRYWDIEVGCLKLFYSSISSPHHILYSL